MEIMESLLLLGETETSTGFFEGIFVFASRCRLKGGEGRPTNLERVVYTARQVPSLAMKPRPSRVATRGVVPEPQKKSATKSPGFEDTSPGFSERYPRKH